MRLDEEPPDNTPEGDKPVTVEGLPTWTDQDRDGAYVQVDTHDPLQWRLEQLDAVITRLQLLRHRLAH